MVMLAEKVASRAFQFPASRLPNRKFFPSERILVWEEILKGLQRNIFPRDVLNDVRELLRPTVQSRELLTPEDEVLLAIWEALNQSTQKSHPTEPVDRYVPVAEVDANHLVPQPKFEANGVKAICKPWTGRPGLKEEADLVFSPVSKDDPRSKDSEARNALFEELHRADLARIRS